ncbi:MULTISPECIES: L-serine ammonia-lyase, iron-sulfur-dependent, subunit alpha [unclassified Enterococcus]|uniref:L-serine ammonia-lyase, iron-sulfur-dependent, subunit alpha n=1 Tax=unclassified Enterococcus TaxID=2608891 RepID=UPI001CE1B83E|nr:MULTISPECIES: L-serine ammonia-lyase, iron-sulfur-dependent, subunit alpha [unclassified Enterococcus]MCA5014158.1 L-serine ammonia-lyase, iron-sulfur-dependent, subunit alpha [Enterococcus sp. S23]MCA5017622.1 L-serine ammonia-lyase, iron-sulfur-dependent, subunit alpha [Enterococcus sp. S22(2020)]
MFGSIEELVQLAKKNQCKIAEIMIAQEIRTSGRSRTEIMNQMTLNLETMEAAAAKGIQGVRSHSGLTGYDAKRLQVYLDSKTVLTDTTFVKALCYAVATNEVNAAMGMICATPTAGSAGVVPGVLLAFREKLQASQETQLEFLFTAAAFGFVTANNAMISGAEGGCQAEIGSASGMAAAALVEMAGGTPEQASHAFAIALNNLIGLACDPVAGLVEIPCIKRNAGGTSNAISAAEMALAGVESEIPADEVVETMYRVGRSMPADIRETGIGGLAGTKTGKRIAKELFGIER